MCLISDFLRTSVGLFLVPITRDSSLLWFFCWQAVLNGCGWWVWGREVRGTSASSQSHRLSNHTSSSLVSLRHSIPVHRTNPECECRTTTSTDVLKIMCLVVVVVAECFDVFVWRIVTTEGHEVAQLVEALRYKPEGRGVNSRWCHCNFSLT